MSNKPRFVGEKKSLRNRIEYVRGVTYKAAVDLHKELDEDSYMLLRANNIQGGALVLDDVQFVDRSKVKPKQLLKKGDILVCASSGSKGLVGKAALVREDMVATFGAFCCVLRAVDCSPEYLAHYFSSKQYRNAIEEACTGSNINNLKAGIFATLIVPAYSEADERSIVELLDAVSGQICKTRKQIEKLDQLVKSRFVEMFGDPCLNDKQLPLVKLSSLGTLERGKSKHRPRNDPKLLGGPYPLIQTGDVANAGLHLTTFSATYSELGLQQSRMWPKGTLCITIAANIAKTAILDFDACFPDSVVGFTPNEHVTNVFMHYWFEFFQEILESQAPQAAQKNINLKILSDLDVALPTVGRQEDFNSFVAQVDKSRFVAQQQIEKLQMLYDSLAQDYFGD